MVTLHCCLPDQPQRSFKGIKAILFDKDGTLARSEDFLRALAYRRARLVDSQVPGVLEPLLMAFGLEDQGLNPAGLMAVASRRENVIAAAAYGAETGKDWFEALAIVEQAFTEADRGPQRKAQETPLFAPARSFLQTLIDQKVALGLVSGDITANLEDFLETYGLAAGFQLVWGADRSPSKPDPDCFRQACAELGVNPSETLMVGDATGDMAMARAAGAAGCIGVTWGWSRSVRIQQADVVLSQWDQWRVEPE
ncbi:MAG: HAD family hydrolase [Prochlorothrix sp.]